MSAYIGLTTRFEHQTRYIGCDPISPALNIYLMKTANALQSIRNSMSPDRFEQEYDRKYADYLLSDLAKALAIYAHTGCTTTSINFYSVARIFRNVLSPVPESSCFDHELPEALGFAINFLLNWRSLPNSTIQKRQQDLNLIYVGLDAILLISTMRCSNFIRFKAETRLLSRLVRKETGELLSKVLRGEPKTTRMSLFSRLFRGKPKTIMSLPPLLRRTIEVYYRHHRKLFSVYPPPRPLPFRMLLIKTLKTPGALDLVKHIKGTPKELFQDITSFITLPSTVDLPIKEPSPKDTSFIPKLIKGSACFDLDLYEALAKVARESEYS